MKLPAMKLWEFMVIYPSVKCNYKCFHWCTCIEIYTLSFHAVFMIAKYKFMVGKSSSAWPRIATDFGSKVTEILAKTYRRRLFWPLHRYRCPGWFCAAISCHVCVHVHRIAGPPGRLDSD